MLCPTCNIELWIVSAPQTPEGVLQIFSCPKCKRVEERLIPNKQSTVSFNRCSCGQPLSVEIDGKTTVITKECPKCKEA